MQLQNYTSNKYTLEVSWKYSRKLWSVQSSIHGSAQQTPSADAGTANYDTLTVEDEQNDNIAFANDGRKGSDNSLNTYSEKHWWSWLWWGRFCSING